jgi:hypothetical protein
MHLHARTIEQEQICANAEPQHPLPLVDEVSISRRPGVDGRRIDKKPYGVRQLGHAIHGDPYTVG